jgi:integrase
MQDTSEKFAEIAFLLSERQKKRSRKSGFWISVFSPFSELIILLHFVYQDAWKKAVQSAGVPDLRFYDVRYVVASEMLAAGAELPAVSAQIGHSSTHTTATIYAHAVPGAQQRAASLVPALLPPSKK